MLEWVKKLFTFVPLSDSVYNNIDVYGVENGRNFDRTLMIKGLYNVVIADKRFLMENHEMIVERLKLKNI